LRFLDKILSYLIKHCPINNSECQELLDVNDDRAYYLLKKLTEKGKLKTLNKGKGGITLLLKILSGILSGNSG